MWFWFALTASLLSALSVVYNKHALRSMNPKILAWALFVFPIPFLLLILVFSPLPQLNTYFWIGVSGSAALFVMSKVWQLEAIQAGLLSKLIPLTSLVVLFSYLLSYIFLGEKVGILGVIGMLIIVIGTYLLNIGFAKEGLFQPFLILFKEKETFLFIIALFFGALTGLFDKIGIVNTQPVSPVTVLLFENIITAVPFSFYLVAKVPNYKGEIKRSFRKLLLAGLIYSLATIFIFYGFSSGPIAYSVAIKQAQTIFILLISIMVFKDSPSKSTWLATLVMLTGVLVLKLVG